MHKLRFGKKTLLLGFLILFSGLLLFQYNQTRARDSLFEEALFIGDSFTQGLRVYTNLDAYFIEEVGMTLAKGLQRLPELAEVTPRRIFILLGINDLGHGVRPDEFVEQYRQMTDALKERFPGVRITLQTLAPVTATRSTEDPAHSNEKIKEYNKALRAFAKAERLRLIDPWQVFLEGEVLRASESSDGLHLVPSAYPIWLEQLKKLAR